MSSIISIMISAVLTDNYVLSQFKGICPFLGVSKKLSSSLGMGMAVIFVMTALFFLLLLFFFIHSITPEVVCANLSFFIKRKNLSLLILIIK